MLKKLGVYVWSNLGYCPFCIRKAFLASCATWTAFAVFAVGFGWSALTLAVLVTSVAATTLWGGHLFAFAYRTTRARRRVPVFDRSRRKAFGVFAQAFTGMALGSSFPRLAFAASCPFGCPTGQQCCVRPSGASGCCTNCYTSDCIVPYDQEQRSRLDTLRKESGQGDLSDDDKKELDNLLKAYGKQSTNGTMCVCDNNYGCDPSNPPLGCGTCRCYDI